MKNASLMNKALVFLVTGLSCFSAVSGQQVSQSWVCGLSACRQRQHRRAGRAGHHERQHCWFRVQVGKSAVCQFSYSQDGQHFIPAGKPFTAQPGRWVGAKVGIFCSRTSQINDAGFADYDLFRITAAQ